MTTKDELPVSSGGLGPAPPGFLLTLLSSGTLEVVVRDALDARPQLPGGVRDALNRAIDGHVRASGFRRAGTDRAPVPLILRQVCELAPSSRTLAESVLRAWYETQPELSSSVAALLLERDIPVRQPESLLEPLELVSQQSPATGALPACMESLVDSLPDGDPDVVKLMVQLLSGKALVDNPTMEDPGATEPGPLDIDDVDDYLVVSEALETALELLSQMPPNAPEWEAVIPEFSAALVNLIAAKREEKEAANTLAGLLSAMLEEHTGLLEFFQCDTGSWLLETVETGFPFQQAQECASRFRDLLDEYSPLHDRAPVAAEELARTTRRMVLLPRILEASAALERVFNGEDPSADGEERRDGEDSEPVCSPEPGPAIASHPLATPVEAADMTGTLAAAPSCEIEERLLLRLSFQDLEQDNEDLEHENAGLKAHVKDLEQQLFETRSHQESLRWAVAYRDNPEEPEEAPDVESVAAAVALARERYPGQLLFQLNAESEAEESDFKWPNQVWDALRWLATDYFVSHLGDHPMLNIDEACRVACGMWYKTSQHETTMTQFREAYTTRVNGRVIWLGEHIGKGNSFDPRRTIRIAFDWDKQLQQVVIGYIGQHQRTAAT